MKGILYIIICLIISAEAFASDKTDSAIIKEYVYLNRLVFNYLERDLNLVPEVQRSILKGITEKFEASLLPNKTALISIVDERPLDPRGIAKAALFNRANNTVKIHRATWIDPSTNQHQKAMIAAMELLGLAGMDHGRYETAAFNIFPLEEDVPHLVIAQRRLCLAVGTHAKDMMVNYLDVVWDCRSQWRNVPRDWAKKAENRLKQAVDLCKIECAYDDDLVLQKGWCDSSIKIMEEAKKENREINGNRCI